MTTQRSASHPSWTGQARTFLQIFLQSKPSFSSAFTVLDVQRIKHGTLLATLDDGTTMRIDVQRYPTSAHERIQARIESGRTLTTNAAGITNLLRKAGFTRHGFLALGGSGFEVTGMNGEPVIVGWIDERGQPKRRDEQMPKIRAVLEERGYIITPLEDSGEYVVN